MRSLFQAFVQADTSTTRKYGGTGLGLTITQRLVTLLGGNINVASEAGVGSRFTISVPRYLGERDDEVEFELVDEEPEAESKKENRTDRIALIVDDDPNARELMRRIAARLKYATLLAENGEEALSLARSHNPSVIILDLHMPVVDGWTVLQQLQADEELCAIPTIVASVDDDATECYRLGAEDFLTKPVNRIELERALLSYTKVASGRLMVVEDNADARDLVVRAAENAGFETVAAENAEVALNLLQKTEVSGVLLDLGLPGMSGFSLLDILRENEDWKNLPVIIFSAQELTAEELASVEEKAQGFHVKGSTSPRQVVANFMASSAEIGALPEATAKEEAEKCAS